ncbi:MAG TPA: hypothetical protein VN641_02260 [Urbifossiella sp.]|nr:hypothetical protein [Urbifossiella sp.]
MEPVELRDLEVARRFVTEGLWLQRAVKPTAETVRPALEWAMEVAAGGHPLPPVGFVGDLGHIALGADAEHRGKESLPIPGWPAALARMYEDHVLGKLYADPMFERAGDALQNQKIYRDPKERTKALAYVVNQIQARAKLPGVLLPPAVIRGLLGANREEVLAAAWERLMRHGPSPLLIKLYEQLIAAGRRMTETLSAVNITALETRAALGEKAQEVGLEQIDQAMAMFLERLPGRAVPPASNRKEVPTRILDEDRYPVGGYTSIANKGSIESLLHSQLAYIEDDREEPDLFDVKYARDELFYYSRDENQFLRRRRAFVFALAPDLAAAQYKDAELPYQRIVMLLAAILAIREKMTKWLGKHSAADDSLQFEFLFVQDGEKKPLAEEAKWLELLLHERRDAAVIHVPDLRAVTDRLSRLSQHSQVHALMAATEPLGLYADHAVITELVVDGSTPRIAGADRFAGEDAFDVWQKTVLRVLELWI